MIMGMPSLMQRFEVGVSIPKQTPIHYAHIVGPVGELVFQSPIDLQPHDFIWVDLYTGHMLIVERGGFTVYRDGWRN